MEKKARTKPEQIRRNVDLPKVLIRPLLPLRSNPLREQVVRVRTVGETDEESGNVEEVGVVGLDGDVAARVGGRQGLAETRDGKGKDVLVPLLREGRAVETREGTGRRGSGGKREEKEEGRRQ